MLSRALAENDATRAAALRLRIVEWMREAARCTRADELERLGARLVTFKLAPDVLCATVVVPRRPAEDPPPMVAGARAHALRTLAPRLVDALLACVAPSVVLTSIDAKSLAAQVPAFARVVAGHERCVVSVARGRHGDRVHVAAAIGVDRHDAVAHDILAVALPALQHACAKVRRADTMAMPRPVTPCERDVLHWVALGKSDKEIAGLLGRSLHTVKNQVRALLAKFAVARRAQLAACVREAGPLFDAGAGWDG